MKNNNLDTYSHTENVLSVMLDENTEEICSMTMLRCWPPALKRRRSSNRRMCLGSAICSEKNE